MIEKARHTSTEVRPHVWKCGSCDYEVVTAAAPNHCFNCGQNFENYDYANGEIEKKTFDNVGGNV